MSTTNGSIKMSNKTPLCFNKKIRAAIISSKSSNKFIEMLNEYDIETIISPECNKLPKGYCDHPDMVVCPLKHDLFIIEPDFYDYFSKKLAKYGIKCIKGKKRINDKYPDDIAYNILKINDYLIFKKNMLDFNIEKYAVSNNLKSIYVKQGYVKCSVVIIDDNTIITQDKNIYKNCKDFIENTLLIESGNIKLENFDTGFIGGTCGMIDKNVICFYGDIELYKNKNTLKNFLSELNIDYIYPKGIDFVDLGSIIGIL